MRSVLVNNMLSDVSVEQQTEPVPLSNMSGNVLKKVIEWCEHHKNDPPANQDDESDSRTRPIDVEEWDQKFMQVDQEMLFEIILVRYHLIRHPLS